MRAWTIVVLCVLAPVAHAMAQDTALPEPTEAVTDLDRPYEPPPIVAALEPPTDLAPPTPSPNERTITVETEDMPPPTVLVTQHARLPSLCVAPCTMQLETGPSIVEVVRETERFTTTSVVPSDAASLQVQMANHFNIIGNIAAAGGAVIAAIGLITLLTTHDDFAVYLSIGCDIATVVLATVAVVFTLLNRGTTVRFEPAGATVRF